MWMESNQFLNQIELQTFLEISKMGGFIFFKN
jgi:hypothetical protein